MTQTAKIVSDAFREAFRCHPAGVAVITAVSLLGNQLWALLQTVGNTISTASGGAGG